MVAERYPVSVEKRQSRGYSLAAVFNTAGIVLFGWEPMVFVCLLSLVVVETWLRRPRMRIVFNAAVLTISTLSAGLLIALLPHTVPASNGRSGVSRRDRLRRDQPDLISAAISLSDGKPYRQRS